MALGGGPRLSVVTPYRDAPESLRLMLGALARQTLDRDRWEVVVADDASAIPAERVLRDLPGTGPAPELRVVRLDERHGPGGARNAGAAAARGDLLVFLDSDVVTAPGLLAAHLDEHARGDAAVVFGHRYEGGYDTTLRAVAGHSGPPVAPTEGDLRDDRLRGEPAASRAPWLWCYSHNLSLTRALFAGVGGFDAGFQGWGHEDVELGYRLFEHLGRDAAPFRYRRDAYGFHVPHFVDTAGKRASGQRNLRHFKRKHPRFDVELYGDQWPWTVADKIPAYERGIRRILEGGGGHVPPAVAAALPPGARLLAVGGDLSAVAGRAGAVRHAHARPRAESDGHLLGTWTTLDDDAFDAVVHADLWRALTTHDLNRMIAESLRLAPRLLLTQTMRSGLGAAGTHAGHQRRVLEPVFPVHLAAVRGAAVLEVARPGVAPAVAPRFGPVEVSPRP